MATPQKNTRVMHRDAMDWVRLVIQCVFLILAPQAFSAAFAGARSIVASVVGGLPLDVAGFVVLLAVLCIYTVVFGRFFCGFACAFGLLGDVLYGVGTAVLKAFGKQRHLMDEALENKLRRLKYLVLIALLVLTALGLASIVTAVGPWTAFGHLVSLQPQQMGIVATVVLIALCVLMVVHERVFCEFLCPLGAIFALLPQLTRARVRRDMQACTQCASCLRSCSVGIYPPDDTQQVGECIQCERCIAVCPTACVGVSGRQAQLSKRVGRACVLAALLLALLWVCGSTSYVPAFDDVFFPEPAEETAEATED